MVREGEKERKRERKREGFVGEMVCSICSGGIIHIQALCIVKTKRIPKNVLCELVSLLEYNCISQLDGQLLPTTEVHAKPRPHVCSHWDVLELLKYPR